MAEKDQTHPSASAVAPTRRDEESATLPAAALPSKELRRKRNIKCFAYIVAFIVFQTIVILVFALTVLKIKSPSVNLRAVTVENLSFNNGTSPFFSVRLMGEIAIKNKNFGHFEFENNTATVSYRGMAVGEALIPKTRVKARKTRRMNVTMEVMTSERLSGDSNSLMNSDIQSGALTLNSYANLRGKVHLMKIIKKRKTAEMNCTITLDLRNNSIQGWNCQ